MLKHHPVSHSPHMASLEFFSPSSVLAASRATPAVTHVGLRLWGGAPFPMFPQPPFPGTRGHWAPGRGEEHGFLLLLVYGLAANTKGINPTQEKDRGDREGGQKGTA